jgi:hypothetical protein
MTTSAAARRLGPMSWEVIRVTFDVMPGALSRRLAANGGRGDHGFTNHIDGSCRSTTTPTGLARVNDHHLVNHPDQPVAGLCANRSTSFARGARRGG